MVCCCSKQAVASTDAYAERKIGVAPAGARQCRDCFCCLFFAVFWIGMVVVAVLGVLNGEPKRLLYGTDYKGNACGTHTMSNRTLTFYPRLYQDLMDHTIAAKQSGSSGSSVTFYGACVSECPPFGSYFCNYEAEAAILADASLVTEQDREKERKARASVLFGEPDCWFVSMPSTVVFFRCIQMTQSNSTANETCVYPADLPEYYNVVDGVRKANSLCQVKKVTTTTDSTGPAQGNPLYDQLQTAAAVGGRCIADIEKTWDIVLIFGAAVAFGFGFMFLIFLKYCAGCVVFIILWACVLMLVLFSLMLSTKAGIINDAKVSQLSASLQAQNGLTLPENLRASNDKKQAYAIAAYVSYGLSGVVFLLVCCFQKKIRVTVGIIKEASRAIQHMPLIMIFPLWPFVIIVVLFIYSAIIGAFVYSAETIQFDKLSSSVSNSTAVADASAITLTGAQQTTLTNQLINAISMCTIAGAVCRYYWSRNKSTEEIGRFPVLYSLKNCFRYHFGSLAFGSFIIAVVQFIRAVLLYIDHQTQGVQQSNLMVKVAMKVVQCCLWCLEKCLKFLSKNAYIMIAMKGKSFCASAKDAFKTILSNLAQVGAVSLIVFLLLSAGKIAIAIACGVITFVYIEASPDLYGIGGSKEIASPLAPILLTILLAWFVASLFLNVYEIAIDTILMCYCEDKEINKESGQYFMSDQLKAFAANVPSVQEH
ncbi:TPA: hypothetical protein N0F65_006867 [Lagenidium giganteum]|uniref:Choline transporter-like protein n=1 Tax=Lagenidium giganteum TaxID=4803 RepID=A0AAV2ZPB8_9STRA|nr:TPA: hypothetical protein N0F65_006867 [Lagenidium giganteum]